LARCMLACLDTCGLLRECTPVAWRCAGRCSCFVHASSFGPAVVCWPCGTSRSYVMPVGASLLHVGSACHLRCAPIVWWSAGPCVGRCSCFQYVCSSWLAWSCVGRCSCFRCACSSWCLVLSPFGQGSCVLLGTAGCGSLACWLAWPRVGCLGRVLGWPCGVPSGARASCMPALLCRWWFAFLVAWVVLASFPVGSLLRMRAWSVTCDVLPSWSTRSCVGWCSCFLHACSFLAACVCSA